jgi:hypothetical protein
VIWEDITVDDDKCLRLKLGPLELWIKNPDRTGEWLIATSYSKAVHEASVDLISKEKAPGSHLDWQRWICGHEAPIIRFEPVMPDKPVVIRPEIPVTILPGQYCTLFMDIPVFIRIYAGKKKEELCEVPSSVLSNTWFGSFSEGVHCYSIRTPSKMRYTDLGKAPNRIICPIEIKNKSKEKLNFSHLCVRVEYLDIYQGENYLWSNLGHVSYGGEDNWSKIIFSEGKPSYDGVSKIIGKARRQANNNIILKSFDNIKNISSF